MISKLKTGNMKTSQDPNIDGEEPGKVNHFVQLGLQLDNYQRRLASYLSERFDRQSPKARRSILIITGLVMAAMCSKLVFAPGEFKFSVGSLKRPDIRSSMPADSLPESVAKDSVAGH
jgi:hypothetical protein